LIGRGHKIVARVEMNHLESVFGSPLISKLRLTSPFDLGDVPGSQEPLEDLPILERVTSATPQGAFTSH